MKIEGKFRARVLAGEWLTGTFLNLGSPLTAEMAGTAGFDWVLLDHEHGPGSDTTMLHQLMAVAATPAAGIVRIAWNDVARFKRTLDAGAEGVMVPWVQTAEEAKAAVAAMRYPPRGIRGVAKLNRACAFGADFEDYFAHAHERLAMFAQIETPESVKNAAAIAAVDGVDILFIGPMDLTTGYGITGQFDHPTYLEAVKKICAAARGAGKATGILLHDPKYLPFVRECGITVAALGSDGGSANAGLRQISAQLRAN